MHSSRRSTSTSNVSTSNMSDNRDIVSDETVIPETNLNSEKEDQIAAESEDTGNIPKGEYQDAQVVAGAHIKMRCQD